MSIPPFLSINHPCTDTLCWTKEQLTQAGLHAVQTFDLHTARIGLHDCPCPNHGADECDCQLVVLLVYGDADMPETLILHGNGERTWLSMENTPASNATEALTELIKNTLMRQKFARTEIFK
jgi:hypothetical protein